MSCQACKFAQHESQTYGGGTYFYRLGNAQIEMRGCETHVKEVFEALSQAQQPKG